MSRPRANNRHLPAYCYRDKRGAYYMLAPAGGKLARRTYGADLHRMLADWADVWGAGERVGSLMGDTMDRYLGAIARKRAKGELAESTEKDYQKHLASLRPVWARVRWGDFDAGAIDRWQQARGAESVVQCNRELTVLAQLAKLAGKLGLLRDDPMRFIDRLREKPRDRYVTDAEFAAVYAKAPAIVQAAMILAAITGLRQGDILRLRRADFGEAGLTVKTRKTGQPMLYGWSEGLKRAVLVAVGARDFIPLQLLATDQGEPYTSSGFQTAWQRAMRAAQAADPTLKRFTFNDLRAKAGSETHDWKLLGHLDQKTFERVYNRLPRKVAPTR